MQKLALIQNQQQPQQQQQQQQTGNGKFHFDSNQRLLKRKDTLQAR